MEISNAAEKIERLELSDDDTEELWNSPSKKRKQQRNWRTSSGGRASPVRNQSLEGSPCNHEGAREAALRDELQNVRKINDAIEGLLMSLDSAKANMETVSRTVDSASALLNTWTRILSQTEHNQRLILNPNWQGATQDIADIESEALQKQQAADRREQELRRQKEVAARKAEEDERKRAQRARVPRGTTRGRVRSDLGKIPSTSYSSSSRTGQVGTRGISSVSRRPASGATREARGSRGRG